MNFWVCLPNCLPACAHRASVSCCIAGHPSDQAFHLPHSGAGGPVPPAGHRPPGRRLQASPRFRLDKQCQAMPCWDCRPEPPPGTREQLHTALVRGPECLHPGVHATTPRDPGSKCLQISLAALQAAGRVGLQGPPRHPSDGHVQRGAGPPDLRCRRHCAGGDPSDPLRLRFNLSLSMLEEAEVNNQHSYSNWREPPCVMQDPLTL